MNFAFFAHQAGQTDTTAVRVGRCSEPIDHHHRCLSRLKFAWHASADRPKAIATNSKNIERRFLISLGESSLGANLRFVSNTRPMGSVAYFPERYGPQLIELALNIFQQRQAPPAIFVNHQK
jgi:hypothetical protein